MSDTPLVSFVVLAYKQERFIREAVQSALAQTYEPLEIILSDDCSPDRTFEIMQEEASGYRGPHKVVLNRNPVNCGLSGHHNRAWALCSGEFIVGQAGDDISVSHRTASMLSAWRSPTPVDLVCSDVWVVDATGNTLRDTWGTPVAVSLTLADALANGIACVLGCTAGYSRRLVTAFDPLDSAVLQEDNVLPFRALLGDGVRIVNEPLVKYRQHDDGMAHVMTRSASMCDRRELMRTAHNRHAIAREWICAWDKSGRPDNHDRLRLLTLAKYREIDAKSYDLNRAASLLLALRSITAGVSLRKSAGLIKRHVFRWASR